MTTLSRGARGLTALAASCALAACQSFSGPVRETKTGGPIPVVATASVLASIVESVGGSRVRVETLVPNGASAETFEPTPRAIATLHDARLLVENGAGYETWIGSLIKGAANPRVRTVVLSLGLKKIDDNPHLWMDPARGRVYARRVRFALAAVDPAHAAEYRRNDLAFERSLRALQRRIARTVKTVPKARRGMIVGHDAWRYYAQRFGLTTLGVVEPAPGREPSAERLAEIVRTARAHRVGVIFSEFGESPRLAQAVADEVPGARVVPLYVDSLGTSTQLHGYREMLWYDTMRIVVGLKSPARAVDKAHPAKTPAARADTTDDDAASLEERPDAALAPPADADAAPAAQAAPAAKAAPTSDAAADGAGDAEPASAARAARTPAHGGAKRRSKAAATEAPPTDADDLK